MSPGFRIRFTDRSSPAHARWPRNVVIAAHANVSRHGVVGHGHNQSPNIGGAEIAKNKIKWYSTVITIDYIDLKKKKTRVLHLNSGVLKTL
jgi:hypothetical protein